MSLLQVKNVSKNFGSLAAVNNISMTVEPGDPHITIDEVCFWHKADIPTRSTNVRFRG